MFTPSLPPIVERPMEPEVRAFAEPYGDFLTHSQGHFEVWEGWQRLGPAGLARRGLPAAIACREYDEFPRGRIVFSKARAAFCDLCRPQTANAQNDRADRRRIWIGGAMHCCALRRALPHLIQ